MRILDIKLNKLEIDRVAKLIAEAFSEDPFVKVIYKTKGDFENLARIAIKYCNKLGEVHIAKDFSAVALWLPPGVPFLSIKNVYKQGMISDMLYFLTHCSIKTSINIVTASSDFSNNHLKDNEHYYLFAIATDKNRRNTGTGTALMRYAEKRFGKDKVYFIENSNENNLSFYNSFGYKVISKKSIKKVTIYYMIKNYTIDSEVPICTGETLEVKNPRIMQDYQNTK